MLTSDARALADACAADWEAVRSHLVVDMLRSQADEIEKLRQQLGLAESRSEDCVLSAVAAELRALTPAQLSAEMQKHRQDPLAITLRQLSAPSAGSQEAEDTALLNFVQRRGLTVTCLTDSSGANHVWQILKRNRAYRFGQIVGESDSGLRAAIGAARIKLTKKRKPTVAP